MPYIQQDVRKELEPAINEVVEELIGFVAVGGPGVLNYAITEILARTMGDRGWHYGSINAAVGVLECVKQEFCRRLAGPYEDGAKERNGDIGCYAEGR